MDWNNKDEVREYMRAYKKAHNTNKKYYESHKEKILECNKKYREEHKEQSREYREKNKERIKEKRKEYRKNNAEKLREYNKNYYYTHRKEIIAQRTEYNKDYVKTQMGRAQRQFQQYKFMDKRNGFDEVIDFDAKWIVDNIYTKPCVHCGETDWTKLGCNRLDNSRPHTIDNVEPCCWKCNIKIH